MDKKMGIEGVGPKIIIITAIYYIVAYFLYKNGSFIIVNNEGSLNWLAIILFVAGLILWISSVVMLLVYFPKNKLITTGPYKLFLNPLYNSFIFFIMPAIALYLNSWIFIGSSVVMLVAEMTIGKAEERYLKEIFDGEYEDYKKRVIFKI